MMATSFDSAIGNLGIGRTGTTTGNSALGSQNLGQNDFLKLLTAQMQNQDPFDPVDNTQMVAQMAQFSSLAGITEMSSTLKAIADKLGGTSMSDALGYVGRAVLVEGATNYPMTNGTVAGAIELDGNATDVKVTITGANGAVMKTVSLGPQKAGIIDYEWDGSTDNGDPAGEGPFTINVTAVAGANTVPARSLIWAPVQSVSLDPSGTPTLTIPGVGQLPTTAVRKVG
jgi:flagellar basal-body rod modification protein FlgD